MLVSTDLIGKISQELNSQNKTIVFTNGCFDIIHSGHISYLTESKKLGDILIIGLNSDNSVKRLKGENRPINTQNDRAIVLSGLKSVDYVCIFEEDTPLNLILTIKPNVLTKGGDYKVEEIVGYEFLTQNNGEVVIIDFVDGKSTTNIINKAKI